MGYSILQQTEVAENDMEALHSRSTYDGYKNYYDHFRLRLGTTLQCAQQEKSPVITQQLLALESINAHAGETTFYQSLHQDRIHPESKLPFRISSEPFVLPDVLRSSLDGYGRAITDYYKVCDDLYDNLPDDHRWKQYLDHHKPHSLLEISKAEQGQHIFLRPDFILTKDEPTVTEIETSPFGIALSHFLNAAYSNARKPTLTHPDVVIDEFIRSMGLDRDQKQSVCLVLTEYTQRYHGQFEYLASALNTKGINAQVHMLDELTVKDGEISASGKNFDVLYRGFYLHQALEDSKVAALLQQSQGKMHPACKPHLEEKALMAILWEEEFQEFLQDRLGDQLDVLKKIIPPTWVLDRNRVPSNLPHGIQSWQDIAKLSRKQRAFVLKTSGFSSQSSWAKGVTFLEKLSQSNCENTIESALHDEKDLFVLQEFRKGADFSHEYFDFHQASMKQMNGRVRFTPYFSVHNGNLLTAKATLCENTDYVHAMVDSINVPVL